VARGFTSNNAELARDSSKFAISAIMCHQLVLVDKIGLWKGNDTIMVGAKETWGVPSAFTDPSGEKELNIEILFDISRAEKAFVEYFDEYYQSGELHSVGRTEQGISFDRTPVLAAAMKQARDNELTRRTSTDPSELVELHTKDSVIEMYRCLCDKYSPLSDIKKDAQKQT
jgi:hypothetical protein